MARYRKDHSQDEALLEELEKKQKEELENQEIIAGDPLDISEEASFKKRYSDLRSYSAKKENELLGKLQTQDAKIADLETKLDHAIRQKVEFPQSIASKEDAEAWVKNYPELAKVLRYLSLDVNQDVRADIQKTKDELQFLQMQKIRQEAIDVLTKLQPDWQSVLGSDEFKTWIETKSDQYKKAIYQDLDPVAASDVFDVFKAQNKAVKPKKQNQDDNRRAAEQVVRPSSSDAPTNDRGEIRFSESYVDAMSRRDKNWYAKNEEKIFEAIRAGKFEYDLTGAAR